MQDRYHDSERTALADEDEAARLGYKPEEYTEIVRRAQRIRADRADRLSPEALAASAAEVGIREEDLEEAARQLREEKVQEARQKTLRLAIAGGVATLLALVLLFSYGSLSVSRVAAQEARANVEVQLQRRADLAQQVLPVVRQGAAHERETLTAVAEALGSADPARRETAASQVFALAQATPGVRSTELYQGLQAQIEGSENRLAEARRRYNTAAANYNRAAHSFPTNLVRPILGFPAEMKPFEASSGAREVPSYR
jgi:LemA protein